MKTLTRNKYRKYAVNAIAAVLFIFAISSGGRFQYLLLIMFVIITGVTYSLFKTNIKSLTYNVNLREKIKYVGQNVTSHYFLTNDYFIPISNCIVRTNLSSSLGEVPSDYERIYLGPFDIVEVIRDIEIKYRGHYNLGKVEFVISDLFGFFTHEKVVEKNVQFTALPATRTHPTFPKLLSRDEGLISRSSRYSEDTYHFDSNRKYQFGDAPRRINWKVSARAGELYSKKFESTISRNIKVLIDMNKTSFNSIEEDEILVEYMLGFVKTARDSGAIVDLHYYDGSVLKSCFDASHQELVELFPYVRPSGVVDLVSQIRNIETENDTLVVFTPRINTPIPKGNKYFYTFESKTTGNGIFLLKGGTNV